MAPKVTADNCQPCNQRKKSCWAEKPAPTCLRSADGQAEYDRIHGPGSAAAAIEEWNAQRAQKGQRLVPVPEAANSTRDAPPAPTIDQQEETEPFGGFSVMANIEKDLEDMHKPLPFFDEVGGACEYCLEPPRKHTFWCDLYRGS